MGTERGSEARVYCKMDVDDAFYRSDASQWRKRACRCAVLPEVPSVNFGCQCPKCGRACLQCPGFGFASPPIRRFWQILSSVRSQLRRRLRRGSNLGFVRLPLAEIGILLRKREEEAPDHWIVQYVDPGPPLRICDVYVVTDRRRE